MAQTKVKLVSNGVITVDNLHTNHGITTDHIGEGTNKFFTDARVQSYLTSNNYIKTTDVASLETVTSLSLNANVLSYVDEAGATTNIDLSLYLDDTNLARLVSGTLDGGTGIATFTRDDASTFTVDFSAFLSDANDYVTSASFNTADGVLTLTRLGGGTVTVDLDNRYLTSFTETDPIYTASSWYTTTNNSSNWDTAFGWGNHASAGYLTSFTETDPIFSASAASGITSTNISNWNTAYGWGNHASAGYAAASSLSSYLPLTGGTLSGDVVISKADAKIRLYDSTGTSGNNPFIEFDTTAGQGIALSLNVYDSELPTSGYGMVVGPASTNGQFPTTGTLTLNVLGEIYAGGTSLLSLNKVWHAGNDGSGSGLDADLLDGLNSSSFVRSDANAVTIQRHLDASTTWTTGVTSLFLGWYGGKVMLGNNNNSHHDTAYALGGNTIVATNSLYSLQDTRSPIFYDSNNTAYYIDPSETSNIVNLSLAGRIRNNDSVSVNDEFGVYFSSDFSKSYAIYRETGAWSHPYPDLMISFHTGVKIGGHKNYNGTRFYNDAPGISSAVKIASIGDGDDNLRGFYDIIAYASDKRLKEKIEPITNAIDKVKKLNGFTYNWNNVGEQYGWEPPKERESGVFAQEVQEVLPEAVRTAPFDQDHDGKGNMRSKSGENFLTVKYEKLVPLLIEAIKEQQQQIEELKQLINK